jgi:hypothetical protein
MFILTDRLINFLFCLKTPSNVLPKGDFARRIKRREGVFFQQLSSNDQKPSPADVLWQEN